MKIVYFGIFLVFFVVQQRESNAAVVRKQPAYSTPIYSNSYLPAAMQVIFHAVSQLKNMESEDIANTSSSTTTSTPTTTTIAEGPATSPHPPGQHQPIPQHPTDLSTTTSAASQHEESSTQSSASDETSSTSATPEESIDVAKSSVDDSETKAETPEENYATPETNHEIQESPQEVQEAAHEIAESNEETAEESNASVSPDEIDAASGATTIAPKADSEEKSSEESEEEKNSSEESREDGDEEKEEKESKREKNDSSEEEDDENRFSMIGEKVSQVPRPSLSSYLKKTMRVPLRSSIDELSSLYDALSKEARRQGLAKYSGYSEEILETLKTSAEGGIGPQLRILFEKTLDRKELTRDDVKLKLSSTLRNLSDPSTLLSRDLRGLIPLRYAP